MVFSRRRVFPRSKNPPLAKGDLGGFPQLSNPPYPPFLKGGNVNPVRNSSGALNPAGIIIKPNPAAEQRGIISNGVNNYALCVIILGFSHSFKQHPKANRKIIIQHPRTYG